MSSDQPQLLELQENGSYHLILQRAEFGPANATHLPGILFCNDEFGPDRQQFGTINPRFPDKKTTPAP